MARLGFILLLGSACIPLFARGLTFDLLLRGGSVLDGTGAPSRRADVAVRDGKIFLVEAEIDPKQAKEMIDVSGLTVCPGFIDLHTHCDDIAEDGMKLNRNYLDQGVTTVVTGNCGGGPVDVGKYYGKIDKQGAGTNVCHLVPQGDVRQMVMGEVGRKPTDAEMEKMKALVGKGMADGAWGMSTGLEYVPGTFSSTGELIALAKVVAAHGGIYASHMRDEGSALRESVSEVVRISREAGLPGHVSHIKCEPAVWGIAPEICGIIEKAQSEGLAITADQYPYGASSTALSAYLFPEWSREGGLSGLLRRLADPAESAKIRAEVLDRFRTRKPETFQIASYGKNPAWQGRLLTDIAKEKGVEPYDLAVEIMRGGDASAVSFAMRDDDIERFMQQSWCATSSDGSVRVFGEGTPHPRSYGSFPRKLGLYVREKKVVTLEAAVRSCTSLPAKIIGLKDRGEVREGLAADLVVFDPAKIKDRADFQKPHQYNEGIAYVIVNGVVAMKAGEPTGKFPGKALRKNGGR